MADSLIQGVGVGLRQPHYQKFIEHDANVPWVEILTDNYLFSKGLLREKLLSIREYYPMVMHGVGLNIGSVDPLNHEYLLAIKALITEVKPNWLSDHLCWTGVDATYSHDLLPLPYTEQALNHVVSRVQQVQETIDSPLLLENVSSYISFKQADFSEAEFLNAVAKRSGCYILLDVNNVYVSAHNHHFSAVDYLATINPDYVKQFHLAGYQQRNDLLLDTHGAEVHPPVWDLYQKALGLFPNTPTNIEWDNDIPSWDKLYQQVKLAENIFYQARAVDEAS